MPRRPRAHFVAKPESERIAATLNRIKANTCEHGRNPCYLRCGVGRRSAIEGWRVIPYEERRAWLDGADPA